MKISRLFAVLAATALVFAGGRVSAADVSPLKPNGYTVTIDIHANEKGEPQSMQIASSEDSSAGEVLIKMALAMAAKTSFPPRLKDGQPVKFTVRAPFFFPVEDDEGPASETLPKPRIKQPRMPVYPTALREAGVVGGAVFEVIIDEQGKLAKLTTLRASHPEFEASARESLQTWEFLPAKSGDQPVASRNRLAIVFETEDSMADLKWRLAPRPKLGSFTVVRPNRPIPDDDATATPAPDATTTPAPETAPVPAPAAK